MELLKSILLNQLHSVGLEGDILTYVDNGPDDRGITAMIAFEKNSKRIIIVRETLWSEEGTSVEEAKGMVIGRVYRSIMDDLAFGLPMKELTHIKGKTYSTNLRTLLSNPKLVL